MSFVTFSTVVLPPIVLVSLVGFLVYNIVMFVKGE